MSNAIKYNRDGGTVSLAIEETENKGLHISVIDTGKGIPEEKQDQLFTPFSRLGLENSDITGTGIGLTITRELTEAMGGDIGFESTLNLGSTFWVEFPITSGQLLEKDSNEVRADADTDTDTDADAVAENALKTKHTVLCVEDNPSSLKLLESIIERIPGTAMISAHTGELGVDLAEIHRPDVIMMDLNLPGITGLEALNRLQNSKITKDIPVIALTARASATDRKMGLDQGFEHYLTKPIKIDEIMSALDQVFSRA
ncbi:MAG: response regulator [Alphaproteobacteria bacterium]|nr:response regulator [Alphaproteobacteria bacterium]